MAKFKIFAVKSVAYEMEIEAKTANEAEAKYWDSDDLGKEVDGSTTIVVDEVQINGERVTDWNKEVQNV